MADINALIFDLDGTLVQTERLKAMSYAKAAVELCPFPLTEAQVIEAFKDVVGLSRMEVAKALVERFDLNEAASKRMGEFGVSMPWQAYIQVRLGYYNNIISNPQIIHDNTWPHTISVLQAAHRVGVSTGLATMSHCEQATRVLNILDLHQNLSFVATRDDVERGKPDPEIYFLVAEELAIDPAHCLVFEDSPSGVRAGLAAGMTVIAIGTPFTRDRLHDVDDLPEENIVNDVARLNEVVARYIDLSF